MVARTADNASGAEPVCEPMTGARLVAAVTRRLRLAAARVRYRNVHFGARCDVRSQLRVTTSPHADVRFGSGCVIDHGMTIECRGRLDIGARTIFGHHCTIAARDSVEIGEDCLIAEMVSIRDHDHRFDRLDIPIREQGAACAPVWIGRDVWLGAKVTVVRGVKIGDHAIVGANAVVVDDIPPGAVAVGVPAKVVRMRDARID